jgi:hypothetical protein
MVGRTGAPNRDARTRCRAAPGRRSGATEAAGGYACRVPRAIARTLVLLSLASGLVGCSEAAASFDPTGPCTADGSAPGAYPELEARIPGTYRGEPPALLDSGRNCSDEKLGSLAEAVDEVRFAGGTWTFGSQRAVVLAVFSAQGLTVDALASFYGDSARTTARVEVLAESNPSIAGREGWRLDTKRVERLQTVVVWPSAEPDVINVVVTNDFPEARIQEAIEAFGDG